MEYDFSQLNDKELEILAVDLLENVLNQRLERFKPGKDAGVDARCFIAGTNEIVMQCKHYLRSGTKKLMRCLKNDELPKIKNLKPTRYLLVTSCPLSRHEKEAICEILDPFVKSASDIFGAEDLNDILRKYPEVEKAHTKLWMTSTSLLRRFLNNSVYGRSEEFLRHVSKKRKTFVETGALIEAHKKLEKNKIVILSGEPGVGKTTLAENLCFLYATEGYEVFDIVELKEAESVYQTSVKQIFLFDDFLGGNYLEAITGNEDSHIVKFIRRVASDYDKRFVLTTRTNILNQGILLSDKLANAKIRQQEYLLEVNDLAEIEKAKILYNHIWHSDLPDSLIEELYKEKRYLKIIKHQNFNPRIIEFATDYLWMETPEPLNYWPAVEQKLNCPDSVWRHALMIQSNDQTRALIKLVSFAGGAINETLAKRSFHHYNKLGGFTTSEKLADFRATCELASKSFLIRSMDRNEEISYSLFNPSIADFILWEYCSDTEDLKKIFVSLDVVAALANLKGLFSSGLITELQFIEIISSLDVAYSKSIKSLDYRIFLIDMLPDGLKSIRIQSIVSEIERAPSRLDQVNRVIEWIAEDYELIKDNDCAFLVQVIGRRPLDQEDCLVLSKLIERRASKISLELVELLKVKLRQLLEDAVSDWTNDLDLDRYLIHYSNGDDSSDVELDRSKIESKLSESITDFFSEFPSAVIGDPLEEFYDLIDDLDYDQIFDRYIEKSSDRWDYDGERSPVSFDSVDQQIHDLFDRG